MTAAATMTKGRRVNDGTYQRLAASVLVAHQRRADSGCLCGWGDRPAEYGKSWSEHVATVLDAAGALRDHPMGPSPQRWQRVLRAGHALDGWLGLAIHRGRNFAAESMHVDEAREAIAEWRAAAGRSGRSKSGKGNSG